MTRLRILLLLVVALVVGCSGSTPGASSPATSRAHARASLGYIAHAVDEADKLCGAAVIRVNDNDHGKAVTIGETCAKGRAVVKASLLAAQDVLDALDTFGTSDALLRKLGCAGAKLVDGIAQIIGGLQIAGVSAPPKIADALPEAQWIAQLAGSLVCEPAPPTSSSSSTSVDAGVEVSNDGG